MLSAATRMDASFSLPSRKLKFIQAQHCTDAPLELFLKNRGGVLADALAVLYPVGAVPDHFSRWTGNAPVNTAALLTKQKAAQHIFRVVLDGLALVGVLIHAAAFAFLHLNREGIAKGNDRVDVLLLVSMATNTDLLRISLPVGDGTPFLKRKSAIPPGLFPERYCR